MVSERGLRDTAERTKLPEAVADVLIYRMPCHVELPSVVVVSSIHPCQAGRMVGKKNIRILDIGKYDLWTLRSIHTRSVEMLKATFREEYRRFREILIAERKKAKVRQEDVARALGVSQSIISNIETGERRLDVVEFIFLVRAFGAEPAALIARVEQAFPTRRRRKKQR